MGYQLYAVEVFQNGSEFRAPTRQDEVAYEKALSEFKKCEPEWQAQGLIPEEPRHAGRADWASEIYGFKRWRDTFTTRQLLTLITMVEELRRLQPQILKEISDCRQAEAIVVLLALAIDKASSFNSMQTRWDVERGPRNAFERHDFSMKWSFAEFDGSRNLAGWVLNQVVDAYSGLSALIKAPPTSLFGPEGISPVDRLHSTNGMAQSLIGIDDGSVRCITVDPPYYDNVNYAECSNFFYVWIKRSLGS